MNIGPPIRPKEHPFCQACNNFQTIFYSLDSLTDSLFHDEYNFAAHYYPLLPQRLCSSKGECDFSSKRSLPQTFIKFSRVGTPSTVLPTFPPLCKNGGAVLFLFSLSSRPNDYRTSPRPPFISMARSPYDVLIDYLSG